MKEVKIITLFAILIVTATLCTKYDTFPDENYDMRLSGGAATTFNSGAGAFGQEIFALSEYDKFIHKEGDKFFEQTFVSSPSLLFQGLGPVYNNVSCVSCHHGDGKGLPFPGTVNSGILMKLSLPGFNENNEPLPVPRFGGQFQDRVISGKILEGKYEINYEDVPYIYPDGTKVTLRKPKILFRNLYRPLPIDLQYSVRIGPPVFGLGLLEIIPESTILSAADPDDANGDGISGRANFVYNHATKKTELGRFGHKANHASLLSQIATAFHQDMGITNPVFPQESSYNQQQYDGIADDPEISDSILNATVFYIKTLAVPARRNVNKSNILRGELLFNNINCRGCHTPLTYTGIEIRLPALSNQRIQPFTDLLLHDMGEDLADFRPEFIANGYEWRTAPLWGLGLLKKVNGSSVFYLHDGRARTIEEAILWHGGEAKQSRDKYTQLSASERKALIDFLESL